MTRLSVFLLALGIPLSLRAATLAECFQAALRRSETVATQTELINQAEEHYRQAIGAVLPTISGVASYTRLDPSSLTGVASSFSPADQPLVKLSLTQPLFRGFREFAGLKNTELLADAAREAKRQATVQLLEDVAQSYYTVLSLERDQRNLEHQVDLYQERVEDLRQRVRIGRSRLSEVLTVQSSQSSMRAQIEMDRGQISAAREVFAFLTGLPENTPLQDSAAPGKPAPLSEYVSAIPSRPDVKSAALNYQSSKENVTIAEGGHYPSLDFAGNYYFVRPPGFLQNVKWDVGVTLTVPIFNGGIISSQVHEAKSKEMQGELSLSLAKRQASEEIRTFYQNVESDWRQVQSLTETADLAEKNFKEQRREYKLGLVTNLDVVTALTAHVDAQRALDKQEYTLRLDMVKLEAAAQKSPLLNGTKAGR